MEGRGGARRESGKLYTAAADSATIGQRARALMGFKDRSSISFARRHLTSFVRCILCQFFLCMNDYLWAYLIRIDIDRGSVDMEIGLKLAVT